jgi:hypothetical protein
MQGRLGRIGYVQGSIAGKYAVKWGGRDAVEMGGDESFI